MKSNKGHEPLVRAEEWLTPFFHDFNAALRRRKERGMNRRFVPKNGLRHSSMILMLPYGSKKEARTNLWFVPKNGLRRSSMILMPPNGGGRRGNDSKHTDSGTSFSADGKGKLDEPERHLGF